MSLNAMSLNAMSLNAKPPLTGYGQAAQRADCPVAPSRVTVESLRQDLAKLAEIQGDELNNIERLLNAVNVTLFGPAPVPADPCTAPGPIPTSLRDLVDLMHAQRARRDQQLVELAKLLMPGGA